MQKLLCSCLAWWKCASVTFTVDVRTSSLFCFLFFVFSDTCRCLNDIKHYNEIKCMELVIQRTRVGWANSLGFTFIATTVTWPASGWLLELVHVELSTISNTDVIRPLTTFIIPVITHFSYHGSISYWWVSTVHPASGMTSTVICGDTRSCHLTSCISSESVPAWKL